MSLTALITGASSGIGYALAEKFAKEGYNLVVVSRSEERLREAADYFRDTYDVSVTVLSKDLTKTIGCDNTFKEVEKRKIAIDVLVNDAGYGLYGNFYETELHDELDMIQLNVSTPLHLTKLFLPGMLKRGRGKILNIASTTAFLPGPKMACYFATKAFSLSFSEALRQELKGTGVTVTTLCPGPTYTRFQKQAKADHLQGIPVMKAEKVAQVGYQALMKEKSVVIAGFHNQILIFLIKFLPRNFVTGFTNFLQSFRKPPV